IRQAAADQLPRLGEAELALRELLPVVIKCDDVWIDLFQNLQRGFVEYRLKIVGGTLYLDFLHRLDLVTGVDPGGEDHHAAASREVAADIVRREAKQVAGARDQRRKLEILLEL